MLCENPSERINSTELKQKIDQIKNLDYVQNFNPSLTDYNVSSELSLGDLSMLNLFRCVRPF